MPTPIIPWIGGKRRLAEHLIPRFPRHTCYVEVFAGGAALYFLKNPSKVGVINDVNGELVNLYRVVKTHLEEFVRQFKWALSSREVFKWLQTTRPETLTDIQRAARFFYLQHQAFGGKVQGQNWGNSTTAPAPTVNLLRLEETLSAAHLRLTGAYIERLDWRECLRRYDRPHTLFYLDPPYWQTEGYGVPFDWPEYEHMAATLRTLQGKAIVSLGDHPDIRRCFDGYDIERTALAHGLAGGDTKQAGELIIYSWSRASDPAGLF